MQDTKNPDLNAADDKAFPMIFFLLGQTEGSEEEGKYKLGGRRQYVLEGYSEGFENCLGLHP